MPLLDLSEIGDDLAVYLPFYAGEAEAATDGAARAGFAMSASAYYEALGLTELLLDAQTETYARRLARSAQCRVWALDRADRTPASANALKASYLRPFFDAVAVERWDLARAIASRETDAFTARHEYEDDFCYARALHHWVLGQADAVAPLRDRWAALLDGAPDPRLALLDALLARDAALATDAFHALIDRHAAAVDALRQSSSYWDGGDALLYPSLFVYVEGLAWLALLEQAGVAMPDEYRFCPSMARRPPVGALDASEFPRLTP